MFEVSVMVARGRYSANEGCAECIVYTWDFQSSMSIWTGLRVQPILADEVQTFKALIVVHKVIQEGHKVVSSDIYCARSVIVMPFCRRLERLKTRRDGWRHALVQSGMTLHAV